MPQKHAEQHTKSFATSVMFNFSLKTYSDLEQGRKHVLNTGGDQTFFGGRGDWVFLF